jgi:hypothetical protein
LTLQCPDRCHDLRSVSRGLFCLSFSFRSFHITSQMWIESDVPLPPMAGRRRYRPMWSTDQRPYCAPLRAHVSSNNVCWMDCGCFNCADICAIFITPKRCGMIMSVLEMVPSEYDHYFCKYRVRKAKSMGHRLEKGFFDVVYHIGERADERVRMLAIWCFLIRRRICASQSLRDPCPWHLSLRQGPLSRRYQCGSQRQVL